MAAAALPAILALHGAHQQGKQAKQQAEFERKQAEINSLAERATAQRQANQERKRTKLKLSRLNASAAASGTSATDVSVLDERGDIAQEGEFNALSALYGGETRAQNHIAQAEANGIRYVNQANAAQTSAIAGGFGALGAGAVSMYDTYKDKKDAAASADSAG